jgi:hypothetical protein
MLDTLKIARDLSDGDVFTHEAERLANALPPTGTRSAAS